MIRFFIIPVVYVISYLPMPILYFKSTGFYFLVYYVLGYRKKVVLSNLKNAFPEKSDAEIFSIAKQFYKHFCDVIFETLKTARISKGELIKRCTYTENAKAIFEEYTKKKQTIVAVMGHCGNWEWNALSYQAQFKQELLGVYHPLSNKAFNQFIFKWRNRFGGSFVTLKEFYPFLITNRQKFFTIGLIADQSAPPESAFWTKFLNQDTAVFNGPEKIAKKFNYPVVYVSVLKLKRGLYQLDVKKITDDPKTLAPGELSQLHVNCLEENIKGQPYNWLWSHKRWKHKRK